MESPSESEGGEVVRESDDLLRAVYATLANQRHQAVFAIGGSVPSDDKSRVRAVLRWDSGQPSHGRSIHLPASDDATSQEAFSQLLTDCAPATFGLGQKEVLDETYRKAGRIEAAKFSVDFSPYDHGIMDAVTQALTSSTKRGVRAELYSLRARLYQNI